MSSEKVYKEEEKRDGDERDDESDDFYGDESDDESCESDDDEHKYWLYHKSHLENIPGFSLFCKDQSTKDIIELSELWSKLKQEHHKKYHLYMEEYIKDNLEKMKNYQKRYAYGDECMRKFIEERDN